MVYSQIQTWTPVEPSSVPEEEAVSGPQIPSAAESVHYLWLIYLSLRELFKKLASLHRIVSALLK